MKLDSMIEEGKTSVHPPQVFMCGHSPVHIPHPGSALKRYAWMGERPYLKIVA